MCSAILWLDSCTVAAEALVLPNGNIIMICILKTILLPLLAGLSLCDQMRIEKLSFGMMS